jgi:LytS/YehU family sensor histidine kinase
MSHWIFFYTFDKLEQWLTFKLLFFIKRLGVAIAIIFSLFSIESSWILLNPWRLIANLRLLLEFAVQWIF